MGEARKQVSVTKYSRDYYESLYVSPDYSTDFDWNNFGDIYKETANILSLSPQEKVVDFGCGNGEMSFCLYKKYHCSVIGIDYSEDAVAIAKSNLLKLKQKDPSATITFINNNNDELPELSDIDCVYFCDVLEHMYEDEIRNVMEKVKFWGRNGKLRIVVHTDNDLFLKYIRPILDCLSVASGTLSRADILKRNNWEDERHVNLTYPRKFNTVMRAYGFQEVRLRYPEISLLRVKRQLGSLKKIPGLAVFLTAAVNILKFLSPSFYAVYEYIERKQY